MRAQLRGAAAQVLEHGVGGGKVEAALDPNGIYRGVRGGRGVGQDARGDGCPCEDWAEDGVAGAGHDDGVFLAVILLKGKGERDMVGLGDVGVGEPQVGGAADELEIAKAEAACAPGRAGDRQVLARAQGEKERSAGELRQGAREGFRRILG